MAIGDDGYKKFLKFDQSINKIFELNYKSKEEIEFTQVGFTAVELLIDNKKIIITDDSKYILGSVSEEEIKYFQIDRTKICQNVTD